jgi:LEA14-like dessication related protein
VNILEYLQCLVLNLKITLKLNTMKNIYYLCVFLFISNTQFIFSQVGINTTSPQETLHVEGTLRVTNTNNTTVTTKIAGTCAQGTVSDILVGENLILKSNVLSANSGNYGIVDISIPVIAVNQVFDNLDLNVGGVNLDKVIFRLNTGVSMNFTIRGIKGGTDGRHIIIYNTSTGNMKVDHLMSSNPINSIDDLGSGTQTNGIGTVELVYDGVTKKWLIINVRS